MATSSITYFRGHVKSNTHAAYGDTITLASGQIAFALLGFPSTGINPSMLDQPWTANAGCGGCWWLSPSGEQ